jgi:F-type H+-transporting ATPase subunit b
MSRMMIIASTIAIGILPTLALAADEAHSKASPIPKFNEGLFTALAAIAVFLICMTVMGTMVWPKISKGLSDRENKIKEEIEAAEMARQQAKDALEEYQQSLQKARAEAQKMIDQARAQQTALAAELKAKSDAELAANRERALRDIESARKAAVAEIYGEATTLATTMAGKILKRQMNPGDMQGLIDESVAQLQGMKN